MYHLPKNCFRYSKLYKKLMFNLTIDKILLLQEIISSSQILKLIFYIEYYTICNIVFIEI